MIRKRTGVLKYINSDELPLWHLASEFMATVAEPASAISIKLAQTQLKKSYELLLSLFKEEDHKHIYCCFSQSYHNAFSLSFGFHRDLPHENYDLEICAFIEAIMVGDRISYCDKMQATFVEGMIDKEEAQQKVLATKMIWQPQFGGDLKQSKAFTEKVVVDRYEKTH